MQGKSSTTKQILISSKSKKNCGNPDIQSPPSRTLDNTSKPKPMMSSTSPSKMPHPHTKPKVMNPGSSAVLAEELARANTPTLGPEPYVPKNIFLTGGAGFIGSHVCRHLVNKYPEYKIVCYDLLDYCATLNNISDLMSKPNFSFVKGDIQNMELVTYVFKTFDIDTVMNFAAQSHVDLSFGQSINFTKTNVVGTHCLLECARVAGVKRFIHVSTDEVYGEVEGDGVSENYTLDPTNPYSCSKAAAELVTKSYIKSFGMPIIITRGNNVYGTHQFPEKVIPKFILRLLRGQKCCIHGKGDAERTYIHVRDVARAFDIVLHHGHIHEIYNIGTDDALTMHSLATRLVRMMGIAEAGREEEWLEQVPDRAFNDCRYAIDSNKLRDLGWMCEVDFEQGLKETIEWYRNMDPSHWEAFEYALSPHPPMHIVARF